MPLVTAGNAAVLCAAPAGLVDASPRVQQACVTMLCQLLCSRQLAPAVTELCLGSEAILEGLAGLLDNAGEWSGKAVCEWAVWPPG